MTAACASRTNWQDVCTDSNSGVDCGNQKTVFDVALGCVAVSTLCALFVSIGFCVRCCSSHKRRHPLHIAANLLAFIFLVGALVYFGTQVSKSHISGNGKFWGHLELAPGVKYTWGPAGWVAGVISALFISISLCMSCQRSSDEVEFGSYYSVGEHSESTMARDPSRHSHSHNHNHNYTSASTNYVGN
jgi:hypothetical protein